MTEYVWNYHLNESYSMIEIAIYDPARYDGEGGARFGYAAEVGIRPECFTVERWQVQCGQGSVGALPVDQARLRMDVMEQCAALASAVEESFAKGIAITDLPEYLLFPPVGKPTSERFQGYMKRPGKKGER